MTVILCPDGHSVTALVQHGGLTKRDTVRHKDGTCVRERVNWRTRLLIHCAYPYFILELAFLTPSLVGIARLPLQGLPRAQSVQSSLDADQLAPRQVCVVLGCPLPDSPVF